MKQGRWESAHHREKLLELLSRLAKERHPLGDLAELAEPLECSLFVSLKGQRQGTLGST